MVLGPNDEQRTHKLVDDDEAESQLVSVLLPPSIEQSPYLLSVSIYEVADLCSSDLGLFSDACDPFAICEFGGIRMKSKVKKGTLWALHGALDRLFCCDDNTMFRPSGWMESKVTVWTER